MTATGETFTGTCRRCASSVTWRCYVDDAGRRSWCVDVHEAPCGLRCQGSVGHFIDVHQGPGRCPRCPAPAPKRRAKANRRRRIGARR